MEHKPYGPYETYFKRPLDILCALAALIVFIPVFLVIVGILLLVLYLFFFRHL